LYPFLLLVRPTPTTTLFPYTTLFRSLYLSGISFLRAFMHARQPFKPNSVMQVYNLVQIVLCGYMTWGFLVSSFALTNPFGLNARSEEHTSELQSRENLVCRLLLEKKK